MDNELNKALEGLTIKESPFSIGAYENPEAWLQMTAVKADPTAIRYINNPAKEPIAEALNHNFHLIDDINYTIDSVYYVLEWVESTYSETLNFATRTQDKKSVLNRLANGELNSLLGTVLGVFKLDPVELVEDYPLLFTYIYSYLLENWTEEAVRAFESKTVDLAHDLTPDQLLNYLVYDYDHTQQQALLDRHLANCTGDIWYRAKIIKCLAENDLLKDYSIESLTHLKRPTDWTDTPDVWLLADVFNEYHISYYLDDKYYGFDDNENDTSTPVAESRVATKESLWHRFFNS